LNHYESRCEWLRDGNFLRDLESDSVDTETLDEELRSLEAHEPNTLVLHHFIIKSELNWSDF